MAQNNVAVAKIDQFKGVLNNQTIRAQLKNSLKENAGAFMSSMIDLYASDTTLQGCDPEKVAMECIKAASLKLPINKALGFAYVVPYKGVPTFTIGYKGLIQLAMRTGQYRTINADAVYEGELAGGDKLTGEIDLSGERTGDKVIGYFAYIQLINGFEKTLYMSKAEVEEWAKRYSPSFKSNYSTWQTEFDKMACKTVIRRLIGTYGAMSMEMQNVVAEDDNEAKVNRDVAANANIIEVDVTSGEVKETATAQIPQNTQTADIISPAGF
jgi:recombination protein RecT